jgi:hypothetical protein
MKKVADLPKQSSVMKNPKAIGEQPIKSLGLKLAAAGFKAPATARQTLDCLIVYGKQPPEATPIRKIAAGGAGYTAATLTPSE